MLLGPPTPPPSSSVFRIERNQIVGLPNSCKHPVLIGTHSSPFWKPLPHLWSIQMPDRDNQHVVLMHDRSDAVAMTYALAAYARNEDHTPVRYEHLKLVFSRYFMQPVTTILDTVTDLDAIECDVDATLRWALPRGMGVMSIAKITRRSLEMQFVVPMTIVSPNDNTHDVNDTADAADALRRTAFAEDFRWQLE